MAWSEREANEKWRVIIEETHHRVMHYVTDYDEAQDLEGEILEHLVKVSLRAPQLNILEKDHYRARIITNAIMDWLEKRKVHRSRYQRLIGRNSETDEEYETGPGHEVSVRFDDKQFVAIEKRDHAEVADREIRKRIGRRGAQVLDAVKRLDTLSPAELAQDFNTRPETITSQFYAIRQKGKLLEI